MDEPKLTTPPQTPAVVSVPIALLALTFVLAVIVRTWGITSHFWLLGDQMRDWSIALGPFSDLPLVGPATHFRGYTIGPVFYWILWAMRALIGPWCENLPHAGGIGQALLQSAADTLLLLAVWRRTRSGWIATAAIVLVVTAPYDLALAAVVWNPIVGSTLAKISMALVLLDWPRGSAMRVAATAAIAWSAVHAYTGAVLVTTSVFAALLLEPLVRGDRRAVSRYALAIAAAIALLQVPYMAHQLSNQFSDPAMGAVTGSVGQILTGRAQPQFATSLAAYPAAVDFVSGSPWHIPLTGWVLAACGALLALGHRRDPLLLTLTLLPQAGAVIGYAFFLGGLEHYYYLSLMPAAVLTVLLGATALLPPPLARGLAIALCAGAIAVVPARLRSAATIHKMPEYGAMVEASRTIVARGQPMRAVEAAFTLPPTGDPEYLYRLLGGRIDRQSPWVAVIAADGSVTYREGGG